MGKFLFTGWPYPGDLHPTIAIADALLYRRLAARYALVYDPARGLLAHLRRVRATAMPAHFEYVLGTVPEQVEDLKAVLAEWGPDVVVCDSLMWGPIYILHETHHISPGTMAQTGPRSFWRS